MFEQMKIAEQVYEGQTPSKKISRKMPTVIVVSGREREDMRPHLPTPRRSGLSSARKNSVSLRNNMNGAEKIMLDARACTLL